MSNKAQVIEDTNEMIQILCDTTKLQKDIETLTTKAEDIVVLAENLISRNETQAMNPDKFERRYEEYDTEHNQLIEKATVNRDGSVGFLFRNGVEVREFNQL